MSVQRYDIVDAAEDACKEAYNFGLFGLKAFYKVSNIEALKTSYDEYALSRFSQTVEVFQFEHEKIDEEKRKEFYEDLKYNEQNLAYLYSMFEKSRTSTFLIHMKILAKLSVSLIENKSLNYFESNLLSIIDNINEKDIYTMYNNLKLLDLDNLRVRYDFEVKTYDEQFTFNKCLQLGITIIFNKPGKIAEIGTSSVIINNNNPLKNIPFKLTPYTKTFIEILKEINITNEL